MRYLIILLILVGCTESKRPVESIVGLKSELREAQFNLAACQNKLSTERSDTSDDPIEIDTSAEPQYETIIYYEVDGTKCDSTNDGDEADAGKAPSCGRSFWDCKDGVVRECMNNIKYKVKEEQKLIE